MKLLIILLLVGLICASCHASYSSSSSSSSSSESSDSSSIESSGPKVKYTYTLWIGDDVDKKYSISLKSKPGTSFIDAMNQATEKDKHFRFEKTLQPVYGAYITKICGVANDNSTNQFWTLYVLPSRPDIENKPCAKLQSTKGVNSLKVVERHYLFWYKNVTVTPDCI